MYQGFVGRVRTAAWVFALLAPAAAMAQLTGSITGGAQYEVDSNVFAQPKDTPLIPPTGVGYGQSAPYDPADGKLDDTVQRYTGGVNGQYAFGQESLFLNGTASTFRYTDFTAFDHTEYSGTAGLNWRATGKIDGSLQYTRSRSQALAIDQTLNPNSINTSSAALVGLNWQITGTWRMESSAERRKLETPLYLLPDFEADEDVYKVSFSRNTGRKLTAGLSGEWRDGTYKNTMTSTGTELDIKPYKYVNVALTGTYAPSSVTQIKSILGYGRRTIDDGTGRHLNAFTGSVNYSQQIGGKTSFNLAVNRAINSYATSAGTEVDTSFIASVSFKATAKSTFSVSAMHTDVSLSDPQFSDATSPTATLGFFNRKDKTNGANIDYVLATRTWLQFRLFGGYQKRDSNYVNSAPLVVATFGHPIDTFDYDGTSFGLSVQMTVGNAPR